MNTSNLQTLPTGMPVIRVPMKGVDSLTVLVLTNTGSRFEQKNKEGIAHFFEHMVFKGTKNYPTAKDLAQTVDGIGADFNAFTSKEYTGYYVKAAAKHAEVAIDVVSDMMLQPMLRQADIDREKGVIIEEINMYHDNPSRHIANLFDQFVYKGTGLEHDIIGFKETVSALKTKDFKDFLHEWYGPKNMILVLAGDEKVVQSDSTSKLLSKAFAKGSDLGKRKNLKHDVMGLVAKADTDVDINANKKTSEKPLLLEYRKTQQAHFVLGWPGLKRDHKDRYALSVLSTILGGPMSSRLFTEVREERGLCYYVHSEVDQFHDRGVIGAAAGVDPKRIEEAISVTLAVFHDLATGKKKITKKELELAKEYTLGKWTLRFEDSQTQAQFYGLRQLLLGESGDFAEFVKKIQSVGLEDVQGLAGRLILPGKVKMALIGPFKDEKRFLKVLQG